MQPTRPLKSFKKLELNKETVQPVVHANVQQGLGQSPGAISSSDYCSGSSACSSFYPCW